MICNQVDDINLINPTQSTDTEAYIPLQLQSRFKIQKIQQAASEMGDTQLLIKLSERYLTGKGLDTTGSV